MQFDVLKTGAHFTKESEGEGSVSLSFEVAPKEREYLDIGDKHILCAAGYLPMRHGGDRQPVVATVRVQCDPAHLSHIKGERPICGYAAFFVERQGDFDFSPASLAISVVVGPKVFDEMLRMRVTELGAATLYLDIQGLEFGWEPDGTHQIWKLDDASDCGVTTRRRITSFWYNVETFRTSESALRDELERRFNAELAESSNPEDKKLAVNLQAPRKPDPVSKLLAQIRLVLWVIAGLVVVRLILLNP